MVANAPVTRAVERELDPFLAALISRLPPSGATWPVEKRVAFLELMWKSFDLVYEGGDPAAELPAFLKPRLVASAEAPAKAEPPKPLVRPGPRFLIDKQGFARKGTGEPVMPEEVVDILYDQRGELGDLGAIVWADGSTGVKGYHLDISSSAP